MSLQQNSKTSRSVVGRGGGGGGGGGAILGECLTTYVRIPFCIRYDYD